MHCHRAADSCDTLVACFAYNATQVPMYPYWHALLACLRSGAPQPPSPNEVLTADSVVAQLCQELANPDHLLIKVQELLGQAKKLCPPSYRTFPAFLDAQRMLRPNPKDNLFVTAPLLAIAAASGRPDTVLHLLKLGAGANTCAEVMHNGELIAKVPALALGIASGADEPVQWLCAFGADPCLIPRDMWAADGAEGAQGAEVTAWCSEEARQDLAPKLTFTMKYWLRQAALLPPLTGTQRSIYESTGLRALPALRLSVVGQEAAQTLMHSAVETWVASEGNRSPKPLVMVLAGRVNGAVQSHEQVQTCMFPSCLTGSM